MKAYFDNVPKEVPEDLAKVFLDRHDTAVITIDTGTSPKTPPAPARACVAARSLSRSMPLPRRRALSVPR